LRGVRDSYGFEWLLPVLLLAVLVILPAGGFDAQPEITTSARSMQPGEVVLLTVRHGSPISELEGTAFDAPIMFYPTPSDDVWQALVPIDLNAEPGEYPLEIFVTGQDSARHHRLQTWKVLDKQFPTRHLTVPEQFATPPESVMQRIREESAEVAAIFENWSNDRFWEGAFVKPVPGIMISAFGKRNIINRQPRSPHSGVDLRAAQGTPVKAPNAGRVVLAKELYFAGNTLIIDHGLGLYSYLAHLSRFEKSVGDQVEKGEVVARSGATGRVSGPHLHWTIRIGKARVDPLSLLKVLE
jgi:murein DD-endopeptidase MepM/ murein hydrolase activator NlpD